VLRCTTRREPRATSPRAPARRIAADCRVQHHHRCAPPRGRRGAGPPSQRSFPTLRWGDGWHLKAGLWTLLPAGPYNPRNSMKKTTQPFGMAAVVRVTGAGAARRTQRRASLARGDGPGATCARLQTPDHAARVHVLACMPHRRNWTLLRKRCSSFSHAVSASTRWRPGTGNRRRLSPSRTSWLSPPRNFWPDFCTGIVRLARERPAGLLALSLAPHTRGVQARSE